MAHAFRLLAALALAALPLGASATEPPLTVPFDFSRHEIGLNVTVKGTPLFMLLDTGVDPSIIDLAHARALGLPVDLKNTGQGSGFGSGKAMVSPATIKGLKIGGRAFGAFEALAIDTTAMSKGYRRPIDGVLGYSFLKDKTVLIDYPANTINLLANAKEATALTRQCRQHAGIPLLTLGDNHWPVISEYRFGTVTAPVTLDTGSSRLIGFYQIALQEKIIRDALKVTGTNTGSGARGSFTSKTAVLGIPMGFGPFQLPTGATVSLLPTNDETGKMFANLGNQALAAMTPMLLLDYAGKRISFYGDCAPRF
jgi:hypothetical protein